MSAEAFALAEAAADRVRDLTGTDEHHIALILGSGWASVADRIGSLQADIEQSSLPGFARPQVAGHRDLLRSMTVGSQRVLVLGGRAHLYEGASPSTIVHGVRTAAATGCRILIVTNAAGSIRPEWPVGRPVLISDHLNLTGLSPLVGAEPPATVPARFCDMTGAYSPRLREIARAIDPDLAAGIYAGLLGPSYETPAEIAMLDRLGADLVGMSTVHEVIAARHLGIEVLGVSLVTNLAAGLTSAPLAHDEVLTAAANAQDQLAALIGGVLRNPELC